MAKKAPIKLQKTGKKPNGYWTKERCIADAKLHKTKADWRKNSGAARSSAMKHGWIEQCCGHMVSRQRPKGFWTLAICLKDALKYKTLVEWGKRSGACRRAAYKNKDWMRQCAKHFVSRQGSKSLWTLDSCLVDAKKYKSKSDWRRSSPGCVERAKKNGWYEQCTEHMEQQSPFGPRTIREFLFAHDINHTPERKFRESPVVRTYPFDFHLPDFNLIIEFHGEQHYPDWKKVKHSPWFETKADHDDLLRRDQIKKDWCKAKRICYIAILTWEAKTEKQIIAQVTKKLEAICAIRKTPLVLVKRALTKKEERLCRERCKWTLDALIKDAKKYKTRAAWRQHSASAFGIAREKGLIEKCCGHMPDGVLLSREEGKAKTRETWPIEKLLESAKNYQTQQSWKSAEGGAFAAARRYGFLVQCCAHMPVNKAPTGHWTYERIVASTRGFKNKGFTAWRKAHAGAYAALAISKRTAEVRGLFNGYSKPPNGYWTFERIAASTVEFKSKGYTVWKKANKDAYAGLTKSKRYDDVKALFNVPSAQKPSGYWTFERSVASTSGFKNKGFSAWSKTNGSAYNAVRKLNRVDEIKALFN